MLYILFYFFLLISPLFGTDLCGLPTESTKIKADAKNIPICFLINNSSKLLFYPPVDQFTLLEIKDSFNSTSREYDLGEGMNSTVISVETSGNISSPLMYTEDSAAHTIIPFHTLIINVNKGIINALIWDDDIPCYEDEENYCAIPYSDCGDKYNCNVKVYVGWTGTDADDKLLFSSSMRLSRFRRYSLMNAYKSALQAGSEIEKTIDNNT